ncbi:MAG: MmgE/PrpD family protein [Rhodospirillaceae bacterium]|nr:MmgE/PrpD family protein [Rhodospirillaceae bacterium]
MPDPTKTQLDFKNNLSSLLSTLSQKSWDSFPKNVQEKVALIFCDDLAAMIAASREVELKRLIKGLVKTSGKKNSTVYDGIGTRLDKYSAAIANGASGDWCELDSGYRPALCHASLYCLPALLAEGESIGATTKQILHALLLAYETTARLARSFTYTDLKLHTHGSLAAVGAAAAVAFLRKYPANKIFLAMNSAATMVAPAPFNHAVEGALVRNIWPGLAASNGLRAADWVEMDIFATDNTIHQVYVDIFGAHSNPNTLLKDLGKNWAVMDGYHKLHACCQYSHSAVEATLQVRKEMCNSYNNSQIEEIFLETHWRGLLLSNSTPITTLAAKFSMEHVIATVLVNGHADAAAFTKSMLSNSDIAMLRNKIHISQYIPEPEWPNDRPALLKVKMQDETVIIKKCLSARGGPDRPFLLTDITAKIRSILAGNFEILLEPINKIILLDDHILDSTWRDIVYSP